MKKIKTTIALSVLLSTLCMAETQFDLELEKDKTKLSNKVFSHHDTDKSKTLSFKEFSIFSKEMKKRNKRNESL